MKTRTADLEALKLRQHAPQNTRGLIDVADLGITRVVNQFFLHASILAKARCQDEGRAFRNLYVYAFGITPPEWTVPRDRGG